MWGIIGLLKMGLGNEFWVFGCGSGQLAGENFGFGLQDRCLSLAAVPSYCLKRTFRCLFANGSYGEPWHLEFSNSWKPGGTSDWHTAFNWTCGLVPDRNTMGTIPVWAIVELKSNGSCRSIFAGPYAKVTVAPGVRLEVRELGEFCIFTGNNQKY